MSLTAVRDTTPPSPPQDADVPAAPVDSDYPDRRVPLHARRRTLSLAIVIAGFLFYTPTMVTAGGVAPSFSFGAFLLYAGIAAGVLAVYVALLSVVSAKTGLTTVLLARMAMGRLGGKWASLILGGTQVGWYAITIALLGRLVADMFGWETSWPVVVVGGVLMASTAYVGYKGIEILSWVAIPLMLALCVLVLVRSLEETGGLDGLFALEGTGATSAGMAVTLMIGAFVSGGTQIGNWARFDGGRTARVLSLVAIAVFVVHFAMLFFGGIGALAFGEPDFVNLLATMGLLSAALVLVIANMWTTNDNAAYAFGVAGAELAGTRSKSPAIIAGVAISIVLALTGIADSMMGFLILVGVLIPPLGGVLIGTFFVAWHGRDTGEDLAAVPAVRWPGLIAYLAGVAVAWTCHTVQFGSPAVLGIVTGAVVAAAWPLVSRRRAA